MRDGLLPKKIMALVTNTFCHVGLSHFRVVSVSLVGKKKCLIKLRRLFSFEDFMCIVRLRTLAIMYERRRTGLIFLCGHIY